MKKVGKMSKKGIIALCALIMMFSFSMLVYAAADDKENAQETAQTEEVAEDNSDSAGDKAMAAAIVVGLAAAAGAIGMGIAIAKSVDGISRQPEAEGKIRTTLMLGLVFVETAIIYALIVAILIIFVM